MTVRGRILQIDISPIETRRKTGDQIVTFVKLSRGDNKAIKPSRKSQSLHDSITPYNTY